MPISNQSPPQNPRPRKTAWKKLVFDCGYPIQITRLLFITTLVALVIHLVLSQLPLFSFLNSINFTSLWAVVGVVIYLLDIVLRWICMSREYLFANPIKDWKVYPKSRSETVNWILVVLLLFLLLSWWSPSWFIGLKDSLISWAAEHSLLSSNGSSATYASTPRDMPVVTGSPEIDQPVIQADGPKIVNQAHDKDCEAYGYMTDYCKSDPWYPEYVQKAKETVVGQVIYKDNLSLTRKCWDCGNVLTGVGRYPDNCNPFIVTMHGRHPLTGEEQTSEACF